MSHPLQADNYSVSDGVRRRVGRGTRERGGRRDSTMIHHHSAQHTPLLGIMPAPTPPPPPPAVWRCAWEWQGDTGFFHVLQLHATPIKLWEAPLLQNNTPAADWQAAKVKRSRNLTWTIHWLTTSTKCWLPFWLSSHPGFIVSQHMLDVRQTCLTTYLLKMFGDTMK